MSATQSPISALLSKAPLDSTVQKHLRKVYTTLTYALLLATSAALLDLYTTIPLGDIATTLTLPAFIGYTFTQRYTKARSYTFYLFAFLSGLAAGPLVRFSVSMSDPRMPLMALAGTLVVFSGFSISALFAKKGQYLFLAPFLWTAVWGMLILHVINSFANRFIGFGVIIYGGLIMLCAFVLYDTQIIMEKAARGDTDHISHAMDLLIDFIGIFKRFLIILMKNEQRRRNDDRDRKRRND